MSIISSPPKNTNGSPVTQAKQVVAAMACFIRSMLTHPCAQALRGPSRFSESSVPFAKSKKSLMKFASICIIIAKRKQSTAAVTLNDTRSDDIVSLYVSARPIITGTAAPESVLGRAARSQALGESRFTSWCFLMLLSLSCMVYCIFVLFCLQK